MSQAPRVIATVRAADGYAGILKAFRDRQAALGISADSIDVIAGGSENDHRYATKWLSGLKALGPKSWGDALGATAMQIVFIEDAAALAKLQKHLGTRNKSQVRTMARIRVTKWLFTPRSARKAGKASVAKFTPKERKARAQRAANIRWRRVRAERIAKRGREIEKALEP